MTLCMIQFYFDPLVLSRFTESVGQEKDVVHPHTESQEGENLKQKPAIFKYVHRGK